MTIAIIGGTGSEGRGLATRWSAAGLRIIIGSRDRRRAEDAVSAIRAERGPLPLEAALNEDAIAAADTVVLSVPCASGAEVVERHRARFRPGTIAIDVTVPITWEGGRPRFSDAGAGCAAEHLAQVLPAGVSLAASFKTLPAKLLQGTAPLDCDEFVCADSDEARDRTIELVRAIPGLRPLDVGGLDAARTIERMTYLAILLNKRYKSRGARFRVVGL